jgi:hypothetical protein
MRALNLNRVATKKLTGVSRKEIAGQIQWNCLILAELLRFRNLEP